MRLDCTDYHPTEVPFADGYYGDLVYVSDDFSTRKTEEVPGELDRVVGRSRLPTFRDIPNLPYVCVTVRELLR